MSDNGFERGLQIRKDVVGEEYVERSFANAGDFGREFQELVTEFCWGASWGRTALNRRDRSLLNLAIIGTLGRTAEFRLHTRGALRNGVTVEEIKDTLIHLSVYAGIPAGVEAFRIAGEVLTEFEAEQGQDSSSGS
ncbi:carboxymuconolactone decarboxylase family protein [Pseudonocardia sp. RS11V-5]|uniref:carboxymuconolactone decarboxylase family protein n=1 Tax=Pseudonocardia terrae TaxID=2905831 RepID=UPI001E5763F8|nr:carboxymuconolactone decarboxylase family protein [Pseudonocardia terrae]MCE3555796.1 carboxymuconolactone decarboxylase family protein [Pseudonocardia terrae]